MVGKGGPWCQSTCPECGEWFTRQGTASTYCSGACGRKARGRAKKKTQRAVRRRARLAIYEHDLWVCQICLDPVDPDTPINDGWDATLDHIVPRSKGGGDELSNLRLAHRWCNSVRGDESYYTDADLAVV